MRHGTDALTILDEIARIGYEGTQLGIGFPGGEALHEALAELETRSVDGDDEELRNVNTPADLA